MTQLTDTMRMRGRLVTHAEATEAVRRLVGSLWGSTVSAARVSSPVHHSDDDQLAIDYLIQSGMTVEEKVRFLRPSADLRACARGSIVVMDARTNLPLGKSYNQGTSTDRRTLAWRSALRELTR